MNVTDQPQLSVSWHRLAKAYGARQIWRHLEGQIQAGEILVIHGPNGSGKSTLLKLFAGLESPSEGSIVYHIGDRQLSPQAFRPYLGVVAPDLTVYRELTAFENMQFFAVVSGQPYTSSDLQQVLIKVGLGKRAHDYVATFSSGMILRMKYAVTLLKQPKVLLLDEPTVMFDEDGRSLVQQIIVEQRQRGIVIIATNDDRELAWGDLVLQTPACL